MTVDGHGGHTALRLGVKAEENQEKIQRFTGYLNSIKPYKARFIANSSSCTATELSSLLTSCLTAVKNMLSSIVKRCMRDLVKICFGLLKIQIKFKINLRYYINILKQELSTAKIYEHNGLDETSIVDRHRCHMAAMFELFADEDHSKLPTLYWLIIYELSVLQFSRLV